MPIVHEPHRKLITFERVFQHCDGAHFASHNAGQSTRFTDEFAAALTVSDVGRAPQRPLTLTPIE